MIEVDFHLIKKERGFCPDLFLLKLNQINKGIDFILMNKRKRKQVYKVIKGHDKFILKNKLKQCHFDVDAIEFYKIKQTHFVF